MAEVSGTGRGKMPRSTSSRKVALAVGLLFAVFGAIAVALSAPASAAAPTTPIENYDAYPSGIQPLLVPDGCTTTGPGIVTGVSFSKNGAAGVSNLSSLSFVPGDTVTMTWTGFAEGCEGAGIALSVKKTQHNVFAPLTNQELVAHEYCGPGGDSCGSEGSFGPLSLTVPTRQVACNFQIDATIGPPLKVVGPEGSYYSNSSRGANGKNYGGANDANMLISANVGGQGTCFEPPTATAVASCTAANNGPGFDVTIANNDDDQDANVDVLKGSTVVEDDLVVPFPQPPEPLPKEVTVLVPFAEDETNTVSVVDNSDGSVIFGPQSFTADCVDVGGASISQSCAEGGVQIEFTNEGTTPLQMTVSKNGTVIDTVTVPVGGTTKTYPMAEDETATYRVTGPEFDSGDIEVTHDCVEASSTTTTSTTVPDTVQGTEVVRGATLPRTGSSSTLSMSTLAGLLLIAGGLLLALANRPLPMTATANTRSRGR